MCASIFLSVYDHVEGSQRVDDVVVGQRNMAKLSKTV
jgi:hypothetical protein